MSSRNEGIDHSLNILKQLQGKLKINHHRQEQYMKTDPYQSYRQGSFGPQKTHSSHKRQQTNVSVPSMVTNNQNQYDNVKEIVQQNRKLKKYVNCLLKMNDYLKNQLVEKNRYQTHRYYEAKDNPEVQLMKVQIQYLKEMNKDKELQLKKSIHVNKLGQSRTQKRQKKHARCSSCFNKSFNLVDHIHRNVIREEFDTINFAKKPKTQNKTVKNTKKKSVKNKHNKCIIMYS